MKLPNTAAQLFRGSVIGDIQFQRLSFAKLCGPTLGKKVLNRAVAKFGNFTISLKRGRFAAELLVISNFIDYLY
jgi:hypothetical protein